MNLALSTTSLVFVSILHITHGFGPAYGGDEFVRLKEIPPAVVAARASGSITLACSVTGSPTPTVAWYRNGKRLAGTQASPGGLGETWARLHLACLSEADAGEYECKGEASGRHVSIITQLNIVHHAPHTGCRPRDRSGGIREARVHHHTVEHRPPCSTHRLPTKGQEWRPTYYHWMALNSDGELGRDGTSKLQCAGQR